MVASILTLVVAGGLISTADVDYEYRIKAEVVGDSDRLHDDVTYDELTDAERRMLYEAFKKSDHFFGSSEASVTVDERADVTDDEWKLVRVKGVPMLVAIDGPEATISNSPRGALGIVFTVLGLVGLLFSIVELHVERNYRRRHR